MAPQEGVQLELFFGVAQALNAPEPAHRLFLDAFGIEQIQRDWLVDVPSAVAPGVTEVVRSRIPPR